MMARFMFLVGLLAILAYGYSHLAALAAERAAAL